MVSNNYSRAWSSMGNGSFNSNFNPDRKTALEKLAAMYRRFMIVALILVPYSWLTFTRPNLIENATGRILLPILFSLYALSVFLIDRYLYHGIRGIDCFRMTVKEVGERAYRLRRIHLRSICFLVPIIIVFIGLLGYYVVSNIYFIYGMVAGSVIGVMIGLWNLRKFMVEYKMLTDNEEA